MLKQLFCAYILTLIVKIKCSHIMPIVLWHGMGDTCCNPLTLGFIMKLIKNKLGEDVYMYSVKMGETFMDDMENGYLMDINDQLNIACETIKNDTNLRHGYNALGFSQGGQFLRALAQRCPTPPIHNFISIGGQHQGVYGLPKCPGAESICDEIRRILNHMAYNRRVQHHLVQSQYWHDPLNEAEYKAGSTFLADINQERNFSQTYKDNFLRLNKVVLVKFENDSIVVPRESEWFGFYRPGSAVDILNMEDTILYQKDLLGLRQMKESGKLDLISYPDDHLRFDVRWFENDIVAKYLNITLPHQQFKNISSSIDTNSTQMSANIYWSNTSPCLKKFLFQTDTGLVYVLYGSFIALLFVTLYRLALLLEARKQNY